VNRTVPVAPIGRAIAGPSPRKGGPTDPAHDAQLRRGFIETQTSRGVTIAVTVFFLALIGIVPIGQGILENLRGDDSPIVDLFRHAPTAERLRRFEDDLDQASYAKDFVQPRMQELLTRFGRVGNKRAVVGRGGFLYYTPGITYLAGPGFLDDDAIRVREKGSLDGSEQAVHADPRPAILAFHAALAARDIRLVLFPVPDKAMLEPFALHGRGADGTGGVPVAPNVDFLRFVGEMRNRGVLVFDPAPRAVRPGDRPRFLIQDTHWTPAWMEEVAAQLATFVAEAAPLSGRASPPRYARVEESAESLGDVAVMLKLPENQSLFRPQRVTIHPVADGSGAPWEPDARAEVLLLGDSFTNVFSMEPMGWGTAAGFGAQLAYALGRGVDVIAQNDSGAFATREALAGELHAREDARQDRLAGKKVVVWEFASRELSVGDWKPVDWAAPAARGEAR
jgi:SGNH hydrolase-like domain, acetyltransferase AlgX